MRRLREHAEPAARILCLVLAGLVVYELAGFAIRWNPFRGVTVPELPTLTAATNAPPASAPGASLSAAAATNGTNGLPRTLTSTRQAATIAKLGSNSISNPTLAVGATNVPVRTALTAPETNITASAATNKLTNAVMELAITTGATNLTVATNAAGSTTHLSISVPDRTNAFGPNPSPAVPRGSVPIPALAGVNFSPSQPPALRGAGLSPALQSRVSRITESEIFGPVMHPLPMALLGIAGECAFLRSAHGQTGLVMEGDSLDDIKLLRIGINRVLIDQGGQKKELMIFSGYGGDSLLPKDSTNENTHP